MALSMVVANQHFTPFRFRLHFVVQDGTFHSSTNPGHKTQRLLSLFETFFLDIVLKEFPAGPFLRLVQKIHVAKSVPGCIW